MTFPYLFIESLHCTGHFIGLRLTHQHNLYDRNSSYGNQIPDEKTDDQDDFEKKETRDCMRNCLAALDIRDRELVILYSEGLSYKEMAVITQIPFASHAPPLKVKGKPG